MTISFPYDRTKAVQVARWFFDRHGGWLDKLKLVKLVFFADREHLARYGRPIVGGPYYAMEHGPVSSPLLDDINGQGANARGLFELTGYGKRRASTNIPADLDALSESDIEVLEHVDQEFGSKTAYELRNITHEFKAYKANYPDPTERTSYPLPYEDFFLDLEDDSILEIIREDQEARASLQ